MRLHRVFPSLKTTPPVDNSSPELLPDPLVPANVDLTDYQYMELDVRKLRDSKFSATVSAESFRSGILLWCAAWHQIPAASLPNNDIELANLAGFGRVLKEWKKVKEGALYGFIECNDGRLYHPVMAAKALQAWDYKQRGNYGKLCDRLRKENNKREFDKQKKLGIPTWEQWNSGKHLAGIPSEEPIVSAGIPAENALNITERNVTERNVTELKTLTALPPSGGEHARDPPPVAQKEGGDEKQRAPPSGFSNEVDAAKQRGAGSRLSPEWTLPKPWGDWAMTENPAWSAERIRQVADRFRDYWVGKAGADALRADWAATWRNWVRREIEFNGKGGAASGKSLSDLIDDDDEKLAKAAGMTLSEWREQEERRRAAH